MVEPGDLAICRLSPDEEIPLWGLSSPFFSVTRTTEELSLVCDAASVPEHVTAQGPWQSIKVLGPLDFSLTGILSQLARSLAEAKISIFAISTYDTDYVLVKKEDMPGAVKVLAEDHEFVE